MTPRLGHLAFTSAERETRWETSCFCFHVWCWRPRQRTTKRRTSQHPTARKHRHTYEGFHRFLNGRWTNLDLGRKTTFLDMCIVSATCRDHIAGCWARCSDATPETRSQKEHICRLADVTACNANRKHDHHRDGVQEKTQALAGVYLPTTLSSRHPA